MHTASDCSSRGLTPRQMCRPVEQTRNLRNRCQQSRPPGLLQGTTDTQRKEVNRRCYSNGRHRQETEVYTKQMKPVTQSHEPLKRRESIGSSLGSLEIERPQAAEAKKQMKCTALHSKGSHNKLTGAFSALICSL